MNEPDLQKIAGHYAAILTEIGADLNSEGLRETPDARGQSHRRNDRGFAHEHR